MLTRSVLACQVLFVNAMRFFVNTFISSSAFLKKIYLILSSTKLRMRLISLGLIISLLTTSTPASPSMILVSINEFGRDIRYAYLTSPTLAYLGEFSFWDNPIVAFFLKGGNKQQSIAKIEVSPQTAMIREGEEIVLTAVAIDGRGNPFRELVLTGPRLIYEGNRHKSNYKTEFLRRLIPEYLKSQQKLME